MLTVNHISRRFGDTQVLEVVSFTLNKSERAGLIGPNGSGKSTLLRILAGDDQPDAGSIAFASRTRVGYLRQGFADIPSGTLADLLDIPTQGLIRAQRALDDALVMYRDASIDQDAAALAHGKASARFDTVGGYQALDDLTGLLHRFGLDDVSWETPLRQLSGGQKTRAGLAALLASRPDLLILDEPTNHLDIDALTWLQEFLREYPGALIMVSHDRGFLDAVVTRILELDPDSHAVTTHVGTYSDYVSMKRHQEEEHAAAYARQQKAIGRIEQDIRGTEHHARTIEANTIDYAVRKKAAKIARPAVVRKRKLERLLDSGEYVEKPQRKWGLAIDLAAASQGSNDVVMIEDADLGYGSERILRGVSLHVGHGEKVAILGPNGGGKSTLIRTVAGQLEPVSGSVRLGGATKAGYFSQEQDTIDPRRTVMEQVRRAGRGSESDRRAFLHKFLFGGEMVHRRIATLSYGERARLVLAMLVRQGANLLLLDEPLNHLDIDSREAFEQALQQFEGTLLVVLHDRFAIERLTTRTIEVRNGRATEVDLAMLRSA